MRKLLTGYAVKYNLRHKRHGHLFQNRYKSIICEDDPYLLELTRYIHLNPLRAGIVKDLAELRTYKWCGHSSIMGMVTRDWQDTDTVLSYFGKRRKRAIEKYEDFVEGGIKAGNRPDYPGSFPRCAVAGKCPGRVEYRRTSRLARSHAAASLVVRVGRYVPMNRCASSIRLPIAYA